jgi:CBS domain-containing protein
MSRRTVREVMTDEVITVPADASFREIVAPLDEHEITALPVIDGDDRRVVGVVSEADLLRKQEHEALIIESFLERRRHRDDLAKAAGVRAGEVMSAPAVTIRPDATVTEAARTMARRGVTRLPVVDTEGRLVGIVSRRDVLRVFLRDDDEIRRDIAEDVFLHRLWIDPGDLSIEVRDGVVTLAGNSARSPSSACRCAWSRPSTEWWTS